MLRAAIVIPLPENLLIGPEIYCARCGGADLGVDQKDVGLEVPGLVRGNGEHLGGYIAPGLPLLRRQLSSSTGRIALGEGLPVGTLSDPGRNTEEGVDRREVVVDGGHPHLAPGWPPVESGCKMASPVYFAVTQRPIA